jgi:uncharacterized protein YhaN
VQQNLASAEACVARAEQRFSGLQQGTEDWSREWNELRQEARALATEHTKHDQEISDLGRMSDSVFVRKHCEELESRLQPLVEDAQDLLEGLEALVAGDYAERVKAKDVGGAPYDRDGNPVLLQEAQRMLQEVKTGGEVSTTNLARLLEDLSRGKAEYASQLMSERGTPADPGLGLLRFAMGRLEEGATLSAEERLAEAGSLRELVEEAFKLREEWRSEGPEKLGDRALFEFFLRVIDETDLGNQMIPPTTDWDRLGQLKERGLLTLKLA